MNELLFDHKCATFDTAFGIILQVNLFNKCTKVDSLQINFLTYP